MKSRLKKEIVKNNKSLFWDESEINSLSTELIVEKILKYGDYSSVMKIIDILGIDRVASIFYDKVNQKRSNFHPRTINYFKLYFKKHV